MCVCMCGMCVCKCVSDSLFDVNMTDVYASDMLSCMFIQPIHITLLGIDKLCIETSLSISLSSLSPVRLIKAS